MYYGEFLKEIERIRQGYLQLAENIEIGEGRSSEKYVDLKYGSCFHYELLYIEFYHAVMVFEDRNKLNTMYEIAIKRLGEAILAHCSKEFNKEQKELINNKNSQDYLV